MSNVSSQTIGESFAYLHRRIATMKRERAMGLILTLYRRGGVEETRDGWVFKGVALTVREASRIATNWDGSPAHAQELVGDYLEGALS